MFAKEDLQRLTTLESLSAMSDRDFEYCCKYLLEQAGYEKVMVTQKGPKGGDGGVDLDLYSPDGTLIACGQCKCWKHRSSYNFMAPIRELAGSMQVCGVSRGIFLATCEATSGEKELARKLNIELLDGPAILRLVRTHVLSPNAQPQIPPGEPVSAVTMTRKRLLTSSGAVTTQKSADPAEESQAKVFFTLILMSALIAMAVFAVVYVIQHGWWVWFAYGAFFLWVVQKLPESSVSGYSRRSYHRWRPHRRRWRSYSRW